MAVRSKALANYRASDLGEWTWVLVRSEHWRLILLARGLDPWVPALTALGARTTFLEEALIAGPTGRVSELMDIWLLDTRCSRQIAEFEDSLTRIKFSRRSAIHTATLTRRRRTELICSAAPD